MHAAALAVCVQLLAYSILQSALLALNLKGLKF
jgi:hypothetical protein